MYHASLKKIFILLPTSLRAALGNLQYIIFPFSPPQDILSSFPTFSHHLLHTHFPFLCHLYLVESILLSHKAQTIHIPFFSQPFMSASTHYSFFFYLYTAEPTYNYSLLLTFHLYNHPQSHLSFLCIGPCRLSRASSSFITRAMSALHEYL